jgi:hypothetical protein
MNTDIRRMIFVAVMGSVDFMDCFEKLHKLNLHGKQEREIVRVLLECCAQEGVYNPFYAHVALKLCTFESAFRFTFQLAYWDQFKLFGNMAPRRASNLAKLLGHLMCNKVETLAMLKVIEWQTLDSAAILFMHALFSHVMQNSTDEDLKSMFGKIAAKEVFNISCSLFNLHESGVFMTVFLFAELAIVGGRYWLLFPASFPAHHQAVGRHRSVRSCQHAEPCQDRQESHGTTGQDVKKSKVVYAELANLNTARNRPNKQEKMKEKNNNKEKIPSQNKRGKQNKTQGN